MHFMLYALLQFLVPFIAQWLKVIAFEPAQNLLEAERC